MVSLDTGNGPVEAMFNGIFNYGYNVQNQVLDGDFLHNSNGNVSAEPLCSNSPTVGEDAGYGYLAFVYTIYGISSLVTPLAIPQPTSPDTFHENYQVAIYRPYSSTWGAYMVFIDSYPLYHWPMGIIINYTAPYKSLTQTQCNE